MEAATEMLSVGLAMAQGGRAHGPALRTARLEARLSLPEAATLLRLPMLELEQLEAGVRRYTSRAGWWAAMVTLWTARRCEVDACIDKVKAREKCDGHLKQEARTGAVQPKRPYRKASPE